MFSVQNANAAAVELFSTSLYSDANLLAYYRLSDTSDSKGAYTLTNNNSVAFNAGKFGNAADFGSANTNKSLSHNSDYTIVLADNYTISWWYNPSGQPSSSSHIMTAKMFANASGYLESVRYRHTAPGGYDIQLSTVRGSDLAPIYTLTLSNGTWYHFALVRSGNDTIVYYNGTAIITQTNTGSIDFSAYTTRITLGSDWDTTGNFASGLIDDYAVFDRALTATEITDIYNGVAVAATGEEYINIFE